MPYQGTTTDSKYVRNLELVSEAKFVALLDYGWLELHSSNLLAGHAWVDWRPLHAEASDVNRAGTMVALVSGGKVYRLQLPPLPEPPLARFETEVITALREGDYDKLNAFSEALIKDDSPGFVWSNGSSKYVNLLIFLGNNAFYQDELGSALERLEAWRQKDPEAILPRLALAQEYSTLAWKARGSGFAGRVTEEGWKEFTRYLKKMEAELDGIPVDEKTPPDYFRLRLKLAKDQGWERKQVDDLVKQVMKYAPNYAPAHSAMADYLMPRWHGNAGDSEAYARKVADDIGGKKGDAVYAQVAMGLARYGAPNISNREFFVDYLKFDLDRIWSGLTHLYQKSDNATWLVKDLIYVAWLREDRVSAKHYSERLNQLTLTPGLTQNKDTFKSIEVWANSKQTGE